MDLLENQKIAAYLRKEEGRVDLLEKQKTAGEEGGRVGLSENHKNAAYLSEEEERVDEGRVGLSDKQKTAAYLGEEGGGVVDRGGVGLSDNQIAAAYLGEEGAGSYLLGNQRTAAYLGEEGEGIHLLDLNKKKENGLWEEGGGRRLVNSETGNWIGGGKGLFEHSKKVRLVGEGAESLKRHFKEEEISFEKLKKGTYAEERLKKISFENSKKWSDESEGGGGKKRLEEEEKDGKGGWREEEGGRRREGEEGGRLLKGERRKEEGGGGRRREEEGRLGGMKREEGGGGEGRRREEGEGGLLEEVGRRREEMRRRLEGLEDGRRTLEEERREKRERMLSEFGVIKGRLQSKLADLMKECDLLALERLRVIDQCCKNMEKNKNVSVSPIIKEGGGKSRVGRRGRREGEGGGGGMVNGGGETRGEGEAEGVGERVGRERGETGGGGGGGGGGGVIGVGVGVGGGGVLKFREEGEPLRTSNKSNKSFTPKTNYIRSSSNLKTSLPLQTENPQEPTLLNLYFEKIHKLSTLIHNLGLSKPKLGTQTLPHPPEPFIQAESFKLKSYFVDKLIPQTQNWSVPKRFEPVKPDLTHSKFGKPNWALPKPFQLGKPNLALPKTFELGKPNLSDELGKQNLSLSKPFERGKPNFVHELGKSNLALPNHPSLIPSLLPPPPPSSSSLLLLNFNSFELGKPDLGLSMPFELGKPNLGLSKGFELEVMKTEGDERRAEEVWKTLERQKRMFQNGMMKGGFFK